VEGCFGGDTWDLFNEWRNREKMKMNYLKKRDYFLKIFLTLFICFMPVQLLSADLDTDSNSTFTELTPKVTFAIDKKKECVFDFPGNKGKMIIPVNSVNTTRIDIQVFESPRSQQGFRYCGNIYRFGPHGLTFKKDILVKFKYEPPPDFSERFINVYYYNISTGKWEIIPKISQNFKEKTIEVALTHFSDYAPGVSSMAIETGCSPNSSYFQNNNEVVDSYTGKLQILRTDLNIKGRIDLKLTSRFVSEKYFSYEDPQNWTLDYNMYEIAKVISPVIIKGAGRGAGRGVIYMFNNGHF
jgi:hypothetical protein